MPGQTHNVSGLSLSDEGGVPTPSPTQYIDSAAFWKCPVSRHQTSQPDTSKMVLGYVIIFCSVLGTAVSHPSKRQGFDPTAQHIDVSNAHAFIAPGASDLRGPCPAMNALANHGYIARNGYTNFSEALNAITKVYGAGAYLNIDFLTQKQTFDNITLSRARPRFLPLGIWFSAGGRWQLLFHWGSTGE